MVARRIIETSQEHYTIVLYKGITYSKNFQWTDRNGVGIDLTGKVLTVSFKNVFDDLFQMSTDDSPTTLGSTFTITDILNGKFRLQLTDEETETAEVGGGNWWVEIEESGNIDILWGPDDVNVIEL